MYTGPDILIFTLDSWAYVSVIELNWFILAIEIAHGNYDVYATYKFMNMSIQY